MVKQVLGCLVVVAATAHAAPGPTPSPTAKPAVDLVAELHAIAAKTHPVAPMSLTPVAGTGCRSIYKTERRMLIKQVLAWIDTSFPDERAGAAGDSDINMGCKDLAGAVVLDISQDREDPKQKTTLRRNFVLRVTPSVIDLIAEDTSTASQNWMEWADEGRLRLIAQLDLDGDGALDIVWSSNEHEGGAMQQDDELSVLYANGTSSQIGRVTDLADVKLVKNELVIGASVDHQRVIYGCVPATLRVAPCAASSALQRAADRTDIVTRYAAMTKAELPDREQLADELTTLGVTHRKRDLVAAARDTSPEDHVQREVTRFLARAALATPLDPLVAQPHPEARAFLDGLATTLGDKACVEEPLSDVDTRKANEWVLHQDAKASDIAIAAAGCGPYVWVAWSPPDGIKRREVLLGRDGTRLLGFTLDAPDQPESPMGMNHSESFFAHGDSIVGIAMFDRNLWIISGGKVVAQSKGNVGFYTADTRWSEASVDLFVDGGAVWQATPTGREKIDPDLVREHDIRRAALDRVLEKAPSGDPTYVAALERLGADATLVAACKALPR